MEHANLFLFLLCLNHS